MQQQKNAEKCPKVKKSFKKGEFLNIGATIPTYQESQCLPYTEFFIWIQIFFELINFTPKETNTLFNMFYGLTQIP